MKIILIALVVLVLVIGAGAAFYFTSAQTSMREVKSYSDGICGSAIDPACGNCPGEIKDSKCYVKRGTFEQYP